MYIIKVRRGEEKEETYKVFEKEEALRLAKELSPSSTSIEIKEKKVGTSLKI